MPFWKQKSKLADRVVAILHLRPAIDKDEPSHLQRKNGLAEHDSLGLPSPSGTPPISMVRSMSTLADPTAALLDTSPGLSDSISSSDVSVHQVHNNHK